MGKPSALEISKSKYAKGIKICDVFEPKVQLPNILPYKLELSDLPLPCALSTFLEVNDEKQDQHFIKTIFDDIFDKVFKTIDMDNCVACLNNFFIMMQKHPTHLGKTYFVDEKSEEFYRNKIIVEEKTILNFTPRAMKQNLPKTNSCHFVK